MAKKQMNRIKNREQYEALRDDGMSKEKAARIANTENAGEKGGKAKKYEDRTVEDLTRLARKIGLNGYSKMNKNELIKAIRNH